MYWGKMGKDKESGLEGTIRIALIDDSWGFRKSAKIILESKEEHGVYAIFFSELPKEKGNLSLETSEDNG